MATTQSAYIARRPKTAPLIRPGKAGTRGASGTRRPQTARKSNKKGRKKVDRNVWTSSAYVLFNLDEAPVIDIDELIQTVLSKCGEEITEKMQPQNMFNRFLKKEIFPKELIRDMQELEIVTEKNKTIQDKVHHNTSMYKQFKICLAETGQFPLVETLQICEIRTHDELKVTGYLCECKNTENCNKLLSVRCSLAKYTNIAVALPNEVDPVSQLQSNLINIYEFFCLHQPAYPLKTDGVVSMDSLYVLPDMHVADHTNKTTWKDRLVYTDDETTIGETTPLSIHSFREIFYANGMSSKNIYVVAEAGLGKSALCERLITMWCSAHSARQKNADAELTDDEEVMAEFSLLFYICLSAAADESHIEQMITRQKLTTVNVSDSLENNKCLVILDGLDEWKPNNYRGDPFVAEGLPVRNVNMKSTTILTTTRPWKFESLKLQNQDIDKLIHITGLGPGASESLAENAMEQLRQKDKKKENKSTHKLANEFTKQLASNQLRHFDKVPVLLMQMLSLWCDGLPFGKSMCDLYGNMISRQLKCTSQQDLKPLSKEKEQQEDEHVDGLETEERTGKQVDEHMANKETTYKVESDQRIELPLCLTGNGEYLPNAKLLYKLSKLAFVTLTNSDREVSLVADMQATCDDEFLPDELRLCYTTGLLTQNMYFGSTSPTMKLINFAHKSHQEFFAAVYLANFAEEPETVPLLEMISSFEMVVDVEKLVIFVCGLNPSLGNQLSKILIDRITKETGVPEYRESSREPEVEDAYILIRKLQKIAFNCATEASKNNHIDASFCIGDLVLTRSTYADINRYLRALNATYLLSASIAIDSDMYIDKKKELRGIVDHVQQSKCLQKFYLDDSRNIIEADRIFTTVSATSSTLRCLSLSNVNLADLGDKLTSMLYSPQIVSLGLNAVTLTEPQIELLTTFIEETRQLQELRLTSLLCDGSRAMGYKIDLSDQRRLRRLCLRDLFVEEIYLDASKLTHCEIGNLQIPGTTRAVLSYLREETKLQVFECSGCPGDTDVYAVVDSLKAFIGLKEVVLQNIDFRNGVPRLSTATEHLKSVKFVNVTITEKALKRVFECFHQENLDVRLDRVSIACDPDSEDGEITGFLNEKHQNVHVTWFRCRYQDRDKSWKVLTPK